MQKNGLNELLYQELIFLKPHLTERFFELRLDEEIIGTIRFPKLTGTIAEAHFLDYIWTFKRMGFWHPYISIRKPDNPEDFLRLPFSNKWGGLLMFKRADGQILELTNISFWQQIWAWLKHDKTILIEFHITIGLKNRAKVVIRQIDDPEETILLLALGCYALSTYGWDDDASGAMTSAFY